jgi:glutamate/aspartate transport system substrate-binding protein
MTNASRSRGRASTALGRLAAVVLLLCAAAGPAGARAQEEEDATPLADDVRALRPLTGTLARVKRTGTVRLGHRTDAVPFSFQDARGRPVGYSLDLCRAIVDDVAAELGVEALRVALVPVTPDDRLSRVAAGEVDLDCGSTSSTRERQRLVAFSPTLFVSATRLWVRAGSPVRTLKDLRGRAVAVTRGTTAVAVVQDLSGRSGLALRLVEARDYGEAFDLVAAGRADAVAGDDVLLRGLLAQRGAMAAHRPVGPALSHEPYALAFQRDDPAFAAVVGRTFRRLAASREILPMYDRWFVRPLPSGERLRLPMTREMEELWRIQGLPSDGS